jgi:hypothetical protein
MTLLVCASFLVLGAILALIGAFVYAGHQLRQTRTRL